MLPFEPLPHVLPKFLLLWFVVPFRSGGRRPAILLRLAPDDRAAVLRERGLARRALAAEAHHPRVYLLVACVEVASSHGAWKSTRRLVCAQLVKMRSVYAKTLCRDPNATLDDMREAVNTLEEVERTARRVLGGAHPVIGWIGNLLRNARAALRAREMPPPRSA